MASQMFQTPITSAHENAAVQTNTHLVEIENQVEFANITKVAV